MARQMTQKELIDFCRSRTNEICNYCPHFDLCDEFVKKTGHIPITATQNDYTDERIQVKK